MNKYVRLLVSVVLLGLIAWKTDWAQVGNAFANLRLDWWLAALGTLFVAQVASIYRWQLYARALGVASSFWSLAGYYFVGMFFNLVLPTSVGGDVVRAWYLTRETGQKLSTILSVLMDRLNGLVVLLMLACVAVALSPVELPLWIPMFAYGSAAAFAVGAFWVLVQPAHQLPAKWAQRLEKLQAMVPLLRSPGLNLGTGGLSLIVQVGNVVLVWMVGKSLDLEVPLYYYGVLVPLVSLLTLLPISLNGMGLREWGTVLFLAPLGIDASKAIPLAFLWFAVYASVSLLSGLVFALGRFQKPVLEKEEASQHGTVDRDSDQGRTGQHQQAA